MSYLASGSRARWGDYPILERNTIIIMREAFAAMRARRPGVDALNRS